MTADMPQIAWTVGVVLERRAVDNPWIDHVWVPHMVLGEVPEAAPWSLLTEADGRSLHYAGPATIELFASDTASYRENLGGGAPCLWVACRTREGGEPPEFIRVTADPSEGEALFEGGADVVGTVPMPEALRLWISDFVDEFHVERVFLKRKRDRSERGDPTRRKPGGGNGP